jgi:hypothetical protein
MDDSSDRERAIKLALDEQVTGQVRPAVRNLQPQARKDHLQEGNPKVTDPRPELRVREEDKKKPPPSGGTYRAARRKDNPKEKQHFSKAYDSASAGSGGVSADDNESVGSAATGGSDALHLILELLPRGGEQPQVEQVLPSAPLRRSMPLENPPVLPGAFSVRPSLLRAAITMYDSESDADNRLSEQDEQDEEAAIPLDAYLCDGPSSELPPPPASEPTEVYRQCCSLETTQTMTGSSLSCSRSFSAEALPPTIAVAEPECDLEGADQRKTGCKKTRCRLVDCLGIVGLLAVLIVMSAVLAGRERTKDDKFELDPFDLEDLSSHNNSISQSSPQRFSPTLERIQEEGILKCAPKPTPMGSSLVGIFSMLECAICD